MGLIRYVLTLLAASSGLLAGVIVAVSAKEELKQGQRWFLWLEDLLLIVLLIAVWCSRVFDAGALAVISIITLLLLIHPAYAIKHLRPLGRLRTSIVPYVLFALVLFRAHGTGTFAWLASVVFLFGIVAGTRIYATERSRSVSVAYRILTVLGFGVAFWYLN